MSRLARAWKELRRPRTEADLYDGYKMLTSEEEIIAGYVRPSDEAREGRGKRQPYMELTARYVGYTKVATGLNATAVASNPLRVMRRKVASKRWASAWETRSVTQDQLKWLRTGTGRYAKKQAGASDHVEEITDQNHPLVRLLEQVNAQINAFDLFEQTQTFLGLIGNAYWAVVRGSGGIPEMIWPLQAQYVEVLPDQVEFVSGYRFGRGYDVERVFDAGDVIPFRQFNPNDPFYGLGDLAAHIEDHDLSVMFTQAALAMLKNGAQPGVIVMLPGATPEQVKTMDADFNRKHQSALKWFRTQIFGVPKDCKPELKTLDIGEGATKFLSLPADRVKEKIFNCHGVPTALSSFDSAALATAKAAIPMWQRMAIQPRCRRIEDQLNARLVPMFEGVQTGEVFLAYDNAVDQDENEVVEQLVKLVGTRPIITQNEARAMRKMPPIKGGDELNPPLPEPGVGGMGAKPKPSEDDKAIRLSRWGGRLAKLNGDGA